MASNSWCMVLSSSKIIETNSIQLFMSNKSISIHQEEHTHLGILYVIVYVDDFIVTSDNRTFINSFVVDLCYDFKCRDLGQLRFFLGYQSMLSKKWQLNNTQ